MKVLYAIQGTGNGHLSRAQDIVPILKSICDLDILVSGNQSQINTEFSIDYSLRGMSFLASKSGGVDIAKTILNTNIVQFTNEIKQFPAKKYDLIISDFEPVSAWSARYHGVRSVELSHQAAVNHTSSPKPVEKSRLGTFILSNYCPSRQKYGFHFEKYAEGIFTPVIREKIRALNPVSKDYYTVYLPAYHDDIIIQNLCCYDVEWQVFSKYTTYDYRVNNVWIKPIDQSVFTKSLKDCKGVLCGAGFELPAEALFLGKKLMVIPMAGQYEQLCNAECLRLMGAAIIDKLCLLNKRVVTSWLQSKAIIEVHYPNQTREILSSIIEKNEVVNRELVPDFAVNA